MRYDEGKRRVIATRELMRLQDSRCALCGTQDAGLELDHCHTSQDVRGLLCHGCNIRVGYYEARKAFGIAANEAIDKYIAEPPGAALVTHHTTLVNERGEALHIRTDPESMAALRALAEQERRTVSDMARLLLVDGLDKHGKAAR